MISIDSDQGRIGEAYDELTCPGAPVAMAATSKSHWSRLMTNPTYTDWRALCARMADELDHYRQLLMDDRRETHALAAEARAALAQPEPQGPTDEELYDYWISTSPEFGCADPVGFARAALARWGRPATTGEQ